MALAAAGVAALGALALRSPHAQGAWGVCPWLVLTGYACPGCGGLRAAYDLSHGDLVAAVGSNAWLLAMLPLALLAWGRWLRRGVRRAPRTVLSRTDLVVWAFVAASALAFALLRNTSYGA